jgi:predicted PurR-regulated permease PerM
MTRATEAPFSPGQIDATAAQSMAGTISADQPADQSVPASTRWDRATKRTVIVLLVIAFSFILWLSQAVLPIVIIAALVAYLLNPVVDTFERLRIPRSITTIALFLLLLISIILLPVFLVPVLLEQLNRIGAFNPAAVSLSVLRWLNTSLDNLPDAFTLMNFRIPIAATVAEVRNNFQQYLVMPTVGELLTYIQQVIGTTTTVVGSTAVIGISVLGGIVQFFFTFLVTFCCHLPISRNLANFYAV